MATKVLVTGSGGLVGSKFVQLYAQKYTFKLLDISDQLDQVDITNLSQVRRAVRATDSKFMVHFAAYTDVTGAWKQSGDKTGLAYQVNVDGTKNIVTACQDAGIHLIHISTAFVFDGTKPTLYTESDSVNPIEWYGQTKALAEEIVQSAKLPWTILRIDQPFRRDPFPKADLPHLIAQQLKQDSLPPQFTDHWFGPTIIEEFAKVIDWVISQKQTGLFHASSGESWSNYDFAQEIAKIIAHNSTIIPGSLSEYLKTTNRPYQKNTALDVTKLNKLISFEMIDIKTALSKVGYPSS